MTDEEWAQKVATMHDRDALATFRENPALRDGLIAESLAVIAGLLNEIRLELKNAKA